MNIKNMIVGYLFLALFGFTVHAEEAPASVKKLVLCVDTTA